MSNKGRIYNYFKEHHALENYFLLLQEQDYITFFKFRTANHKMPIEVGRWDGTPLIDRKCILCNSDSVGSEKHYLLECGYFNEARHKYLQNSNFECVDLHLKALLSSKSNTTLEKLCQFLRIIMKQFK